MPSPPAPRILIVDDDPAVAATLTLVLRGARYATATAATPAEAAERLAEGPFALVLQDMNFSRRTTGEEGLELLRSIKRAHPLVPVVLMTAWGSIALAVRGMQAGAADFVPKPWTNGHLLATVETALRLVAVRAGDAPPSSRAALDARYRLEGIVGEAPAFLAALELALRVAPTEATVLVTGETGTGKEVVADAIHRNSARANGPLVRVNVGGIPAGLFESELFGHVRGAFTDAHRDRAGRFEAAQGGTLFLDEIGDLDPAAQVKLLRVLQDRTYEPLGSSETRTADVRVVSATHRSLPERVAAGRFREDLLFRLNLITVHLPPLRERPGDVPLLAAHFLADAARTYRRPALSLTDAARAFLAALPWPGNVRQLRHVIERAVLVAARPALEPDDFALPLRMDAAEPRAEPSALPAPGTMTLDALERAMIERCLDRYHGNLSRAADALGLTRQALYRRMEKHGLRGAAGDE